MAFVARWGQPGTHTMPINSVGDLDAALDKAAAHAGDIPLLVHVDSPTGGIELVIGHPLRSTLAHTHDGHRVRAVQRDIEPLNWPILADVDGQFCGFPPTLTRIRPDIARQAAHEFVTTGQRPTCVTTWSPEIT